MEGTAETKGEGISGEAKERSSITIIVPEVSDLPRSKPKSSDWSDFEIAYIRKYYPDRQYSVLDIAKCLGRSYESVERKAWKIGLRRNV
jgi:hypothetical protein